MESEVKLFIYGIILILVPTVTVNAGKVTTFNINITMFTVAASTEFLP